MGETALYECMTKCHVPVATEFVGPTGVSQVIVVNKLFIPQNPDGGVDENLCKYQVPQGELVPHHFRAINDVAKNDREDQISNPEKYISTEYDIGCIAELMVDRGFYDDEMFYDERRGQYVTRKSAKRVAMESIRDTIGEHVYRALLNGESNAVEYKNKETAVAELCKLGSDDTETRKVLIKMLTDANITKGYFRGSPVKKIAEFVYENGLYEG